MYNKSTEVVTHNHTSAINKRIKLDAIFDAEFNVHQVIQQLILLEDHLFHQHRQCFDCIFKHLTTASAFANEAHSLTRGADWAPVMDIIAHKCDDWQQRVFKSANATNSQAILRKIAEDIRPVRKQLSSTYIVFMTQKK